MHSSILVISWKPKPRAGGFGFTPTMLPWGLHWVSVLVTLCMRAPVQSPDLLVCPLECFLQWTHHFWLYVCSKAIVLEAEICQTQWCVFCLLHVWAFDHAQQLWIQTIMAHAFADQRCCLLVLALSCLVFHKADTSNLESQAWVSLKGASQCVLACMRWSVATQVLPDVLTVQTCLDHELYEAFDAVMAKTVKWRHLTVQHAQAWHSYPLSWAMNSIRMWTLLQHLISTKRNVHVLIKKGLSISWDHRWKGAASR